MCTCFKIMPPCVLQDRKYVRVCKTELLRQEVEGIAWSVSTLPRLKARVPGATDKLRITEELPEDRSHLWVVGVCRP